MDYTETSTHTTSTSGSSYSASAPLRNVQFDPSNAGVIEEQQQKIKHLQEQLAEFNRVRYRTLPANASGGKNVVWTSKRKSLTGTDQINQQAVASYLREAIWPSNKILPTKWSKWREDRNSLCQMILQKVAIPVGVDGKSYWESMILGFTNEKFCALRANFKQELFEQFQGKFSRINICIAAYSNNQYLFALYLYVEDKEVGWNPPSDNDGRIYANFRRWTTDLQDTPPTYDQAEHFLRFLDKYVSRAVGSHYFSQWSKSNRSKTFMDKVTASDISYTILVYENSKEVWEEELQIRVKSMSEDERKKATRKQKPKYHEGRGKRLQRFGDGWTDNGRKYYQELLGIFRNLKSSDVWKTLQDHWKMYQREHYNKSDSSKDDDLRRPEEECEQSDEEDWRITVEDEEQCDDNEVSLSDDDGEPQSKRQRISL